MTRFEYVLCTAVAPHQEPLAEIARAFALAVEQTIAEGEDAGNDPAVLVLGAYIAFHTHADVATAQGYYRLLALCEQRFFNAPELQ